MALRLDAVARSRHNFSMSRQCFASLSQQRFPCRDQDGHNKRSCDALKPGGPYTQIPCCDTLKSEGPADNSSIHGIFMVTFLYIFLTNIQILIIFYNSLMFNSFTCQSILKLDCSNIFYKNTSQGHNPTFFVLTALKERRFLVYLKGWSHNGVSKAQ